uniref:Uncharacterized protein n=1 Tax=Arundo donax TaxID=35708 RepID=A0A0A9GJJ5_ARUDO
MGMGIWSTRPHAQRRCQRQEAPAPTSPGRPAAAGQPTRWTPQFWASSPSSTQEPPRSSTARQLDK